MEKHPAATLRQLDCGDTVLKTIAGIDLALMRVGTEYRAYRNICPHAGAPLFTGGVSADTPSAPAIVRCPWHGWEFDLASGEHLLNPACKLETLRVEIDRDIVYVMI